MKNLNVVFFGFYDFMYFFGYVCLGLMWGKMVCVLLDVLVNGMFDIVFYEVKLVIVCYYMVCCLFVIVMYFVCIESGVDLVMVLDVEVF